MKLAYSPVRITRIGSLPRPHSRSHPRSARVYSRSPVVGPRRPACARSMPRADEAAILQIARRDGYQLERSMRWFWSPCSTCVASRLQNHVRRITVASEPALCLAGLTADQTAGSVRSLLLPRPLYPHRAVCRTRNHHH